MGQDFSLLAVFAVTVAREEVWRTFSLYCHHTIVNKGKAKLVGGKFPAGVQERGGIGFPPIVEKTERGEFKIIGLFPSNKELP